MSSSPDPFYWAKTNPDATGREVPGVTVRTHCLNVGWVAWILAGLSPHPTLDRALLAWLAAGHDIGKISLGFEAKSPVWLESSGFAQEYARVQKVLETDHSRTSQFTLQFWLRDKLGLFPEDAALWAAAVGMHHGTPHWSGQWNPAANSGIARGDTWDQARHTLLETITTCFHPAIAPPALELDDLSALWWTAGLITVADWIGSDERYFSPDRENAPAEPSSIEPAAAHAVQDAGFAVPAMDGAKTFSDLFPGKLPRALQKACLEVIREPGVYVIEAPMGMGKTEAALAAAHHLISHGHARGLYFALPTQATSNRIQLRVSDFLHECESHGPRLIHGGSWLLDPKITFPRFEADQPESQRATARDWFASPKRALLAPYGVGTIDQALLGVIAVKHFFVRHYALAGKVVVLDEIHSYDVYTGTLVEALIAALVKLRCTVIILSATLTKARREQLLSRAGGGAPVTSDGVDKPEPHTLISGVVNGRAITPRSVPSESTKQSVKIHFRSEEKCRREAIAAARDGACVLWICNTVERAIATYSYLAGNALGSQVALLHSRFPFLRRQQLENEWMEKLGENRALRPRGCILISTQIVEQSVDLDSDLLISELAPTDMLLQRIGRLWRHDAPHAREEPEVWVIEEEKSLEHLQQEDDPKALIEALGKKANIYAPYVLLRTLEQWRQKTELQLPEDIRPWLEATYVERSEDDRPGWRALRAKLDAERADHVGQADFAQAVWSRDPRKDEEGVATRLNQLRTLPLILATAASSTTLTLLDGTEVPIASHYFNYDTAKALHRNLVKIPTWWCRESAAHLQSVPDAVAKMIALHIRGPVAAAILDRVSVPLPGLPPQTALEYDAQHGLRLRKIAAEAAAKPRYLDDDMDEYEDD